MSEPTDMEALKAELSGLAIQVGQEAFGISLDRSIDSVKQVDHILGALHDEYQRTGDDEGLSGLALEFGAYLIEVIETNFEAGVWSADHPSLGPQTFPYEWRDGAIFPVAWCEKRIFDGPGDDVWSKFDIFVMQKAASTEGPNDKNLV